MCVCVCVCVGAWDREREALDESIHVMGAHEWKVTRGRKRHVWQAVFSLANVGECFFYLFLLASPSDEYPPPLSMSTASGIA